jgi:hypothetical protein
MAGFNGGNAFGSAVSNVKDAVGSTVKNIKKGDILEEGQKQLKTAVDTAKNTATAGVQEHVIRPTMEGINSIKEAGERLGAAGTAAWKRAEEQAKKLGGKAEDWFNKMNSMSGSGGLIPNVGVGVGGFPGGGAPTGPVQIQALNGQGGTAGVGDQNEFRQQQMTLAQQLAQQAAGQGPSLATEQLKQAQAANQAATFAQLASARGGANPGLARQAMQTSAQIQGQAARDAALARIQEQMGAREQLAGVAGQGRQGDIQVAGQGNELAVAQAQLAQQHAELQAKYTAMGLDAEKANQMAAIEMEKMDRGLMSPAQQALQTGTGILTSIFA